MLQNNNTISLEDKFYFENLSPLVNVLSIMTHHMSKEKKVWIEYPNINIENNNINIFFWKF